MKRQLLHPSMAASCYFRTTVVAPNRKALIQITERCNLFCAHCFVSSGDYGDTMSLDAITNDLLPKLLRSRVVSVTLTGGEPFVHPELIQIAKLFRAAGIEVSICSNGTKISADQLSELVHIGGIQVNISLDGFRAETHGKFRGNRESFHITVDTIRSLGKAGLLKGLLVTPNNLAAEEEYAEICDLAIQSGAKYVLLNPLSRFGRGVKTMKLSSPRLSMTNIKQMTSAYSDRVELVHIRFPNSDLPLASCEAGNIIYIFTGGEVTVCPYLVFSSKTPGSQHNPNEFIVGNIFSDTDIAEKLDAYSFSDRYKVGSNETCKGCGLDSQCGKGCPAAIIADGGRIGDVDRDVCPIVHQATREKFERHHEYQIPLTSL